MKNFNKNNLEYYTFGLSTSIIDEVISYVINNYSKEEFKNVCIIFSGKRPSVIFKKNLSKRVKNGFLPPKIFSIEEFVHFVVSTQKQLSFVSELEIIYFIYKIITDEGTFSSKFKSFIEFVPWGYEIFSFLEEMMLENIEPKQLIFFSEEETLFDEKIPPSIKNVVKNISDVYDKFYNYLIQQELFTRGLCYKLASEYSRDLQLAEFNKIIFVSPFYLHKTELTLISNLTKNNKITIFFQGDQTDWKQLENIANYFNISIRHPKENDINKNIYFYSAFDTVSEANCVYNIIKELSSDELDKTVIVLPSDENATLLINSLPDNVKEYNLVCGYPLKRNVIISLFKDIIDAQITKKNNKYYTKQYLKIIKNTLLRNINFDISSITVAKESSLITTFILDCIEDIILGKVNDNKVSKANFIELKDILQSKVLSNHIQETLSLYGYKIKIEDIAEIINVIHKNFFLQWEKVNTIKKFCKCVKETLNLILKNTEIEKNILNLYSINKLLDIVDELENTSFSEEEFLNEEIFKLCFIKIEQTKLSFFGSPIKGLQILGFYETRNLNFDRVIICDINEGILPHLERKSTLIPYTLLLKTNINRLEIEEEIQRYHFLRLVSQAKEVFFVFIESDEKEKSRFVEQIIWDIQKKEKTLDFKNIYFCYYPISVQIKKHEIKKTDDVIKYLKNFCYSPTAIDIYLKCPLKFHNMYVLGLQEQEEIDEPEGKDIGEFLHSLLAESFNKFVGQKPIIDTEFKKNFLKLFEQKFDLSLAKQYKSESFLIKKVMKLYLEQFIVCEQQRIEQDQVEQILLIEKTYEDKLYINNKQICFKYRIDRVDKLKDGSLLVIDYKTGYIPQMNKNLKLEEMSYRNIKKQIKSFQLPLYIDIVKKKFNCEDVDAMFYNIKEPDKIYRLVKNSKSKKEEIMNIVFLSLNYIIDEILNPQVPFYEDTEEPQNCDQCSFKYLCK